MAKGRVPHFSSKAYCSEHLPTEQKTQATIPLHLEGFDVLSFPSKDAGETLPRPIFRCFLEAVLPKTAKSRRYMEPEGRGYVGGCGAQWEESCLGKKGALDSRMLPIGQKLSQPFFPVNIKARYTAPGLKGLEKRSSGRLEESKCKARQAE